MKQLFFSPNMTNQIRQEYFRKFNKLRAKYTVKPAHSLNSDEVSSNDGDRHIQRPLICAWCSDGSGKSSILRILISWITIFLTEMEFYKFALLFNG